MWLIAEGRVGSFLMGLTGHVADSRLHRLVLFPTRCPCVGVEIPVMGATLVCRTLAPNTSPTFLQKWARMCAHMCTMLTRMTHACAHLCTMTCTTDCAEMCMHTYYAVHYCGQFCTYVRPNMLAWFACLCAVVHTYTCAHLCTTSCHIVQSYAHCAYIYAYLLISVCV